MRTLLTILFLGLSTLKAQEVPFYIKGSTLTGTGTIETIDYDHLICPHYELRIKFDTIKVKILYEQGEAIMPIFIKGWQVMQFNKWIQGDPIFLKWSDPKPDQWIETDIFLFEDKKTRIDNARKWGYKVRPW